MKLTSRVCSPFSDSFLKGVLALGLGALAMPSASAAVLLVVDVSNPAAVTITATGANPSANESDTWTFDGIDLLGFFTGNVGNATGLLDAGSNLKPTGSVNTYDSWVWDDFSTDGGNAVDLNVYFDSLTEDPQNFDITQPAFSGSATLNLSALSGLLPAPGASGSVLAGFSDFEGPIIGEYTVVPEATPAAQAAVFGLGAAGLLLLRRRQPRPV